MNWTVYDKNNSERCVIHKLEYSGEFMGERFVTASIKSPVPIEFEIGDYFIYRGEQFILNYDPSVIKKSSQNKAGDAFTYENIKFNSFGDELVRCEFLDYVLNDNEIHFSSLPSFGFHALTIQDLADRIQANLNRVYTGSKAWTVNVNAENVTVTNVFVTADRLTIWGALALVSSIFKSNFIIRGRTITIGTAGSVIDNVFEYGKGRGLNKITRVAESDQQIITRLRVYGSTRNLPSRYYNKLTKPDTSKYLPDNMAVQNLMLPSFPYSTLNPYLDSDNISELGVMEGSVFFDGSDDSLPEIYPSLEGMTAQELIDAGIPVFLDPGDNGNLDEIKSDSVNADGTAITDDGIYEDGATVPAFLITIKDIGFNLWDYRVNGENPVISMKDGMCGGREFEILSCVKDGNKYVLTCNRELDDGIGLYFPYSGSNIRSGDKFVLLNIEMPEVYIQAASQRLLSAGLEYLSRNDYVRYTYEMNISPVYMARNEELRDSIIEGDLLSFADTDLSIDGSIIIDSLRIKEGEELIPKYEVTLAEEKQIGTIDKIQNQIDYILNNHGGRIQQISNTIISKIGNIKVGAINLLRNTGFLGDFLPLNVDAITAVLEETEVNTNPLAHWVHSDAEVVDAPSRSGKGVKLGSIQQTVALRGGVTYRLSFKAKGNSLSLTLSNNFEVKLTGDYMKYSFTITPGETNAYTFALSDTSNSSYVYEIMLSEGNTDVDYSYSQYDDLKAISQLQAINAITEVIKEYDTDFLGGLILTSMIQLGKYKDGVMEKVNAGISGLYNNDDDPAAWFGGNLEKAIRTVQRLKSNPYNVSDEEWEELANIVFTHGGDGFFKGIIYALGGIFRGRIETSVSGNRIIIDPSEKSLNMYNSQNQKVLSMDFSEHPMGFSDARINVYAYDEEGNVLSNTQVLPSNVSVMSTSVVGGTLIHDRTSLSLGQIQMWGYSDDGATYTERYRFEVSRNTIAEGMSLEIKTTGMATTGDDLAPGMWYVDNGTIKIKQ